MQDLLQSPEDGKSLLPCGQGIPLARSHSQSLECKTEQHEEEGNRLISVIDARTLGLAVGGRGLGLLPVQCIEYELAVLLDEAGNCVDELEPRILVELEQGLAVECSVDGVETSR